MIFAWFSFLTLLAGAASLYLATPHQALLAAPANRRALRIAGVANLATALALLLALMGPATAVFTWTIGLMLLWSVPPIAIRWLRYRKETAR